jgi:hypothetical protein
MFGTICAFTNYCSAPLRPIFVFDLYLFAKQDLRSCVVRHFFGIEVKNASNSDCGRS